MNLDPKQFLGQPLPDMIADLNRIGPAFADLALQGRVQLHGADLEATTLLDSVSFRPGTLLPSPADTQVPINHATIDVPGVILESYLGGGSQGLVYVGRVTATQKVLAVKVLRTEYVASRRWAAREAVVCARVCHPNVLRVFQVQPAGAFWVVLMELVQGGELGSDRLPADTARTCFGQLAGALHALASKRIVHCDIKPGNILLRRQDASPVLVDFGLAADLDQAEADGRTGKISGTPLFMAPEAFQTGRPDPAWDAYALGVSAAFVLGGEGLRYASLQTLFEAKLSGEFERKIERSLERIDDADLRQWILALLDRDPHQRLAALDKATRWRAA